MMIKISSCTPTIVTTGRWYSRSLHLHAANARFYVPAYRTATIPRLLSSSSIPQQNLTPEGEVVTAVKNTANLAQHEVVRFPSSVRTKLGSSTAASSTANLIEKEESIPVLLNSKEHAVGYLSKILNARVYDAAIETDLQEAKNLSSVRYQIE